MKSAENYAKEYLPELFSSTLPKNIDTLRKGTCVKRDHISNNNYSIDSHIDFLIIADRPTIQTSRIAIAAENNYNVQLLSRWPSEAIDEVNKSILILYYDNIADLKYIKVSNNTEVLVMSWVGWNFFPFYISSIIDKDVSIIHNDLIDILLNDEKHCIHIGMSQTQYYDDIDFLNISGKNAKLNINTLYSSSNSSLLMQSNVINCEMRPLKCIYHKAKKSIKSVDNSILFGGMIPKESAPSMLFKDAQMTEYFSKLRSKRQMHCITSSPYKYQDNLMETNPALHQVKEKLSFQLSIQKGLSFFDMPSLSWMFKYGLLYMDCSPPFEINEEHYKYILPTKLSMYIENDMPILINRDFTYAFTSITSWGVGAEISNNDLGSFDNRVSDIDNQYSEMRKSIVNFVLSNCLENALMMNYCLH